MHRMAVDKAICNPIHSEYGAWRTRLGNRLTMCAQIITDSSTQTHMYHIRAFINNYITCTRNLESSGSPRCINHSRYQLFQLEPRSSPLCLMSKLLLSLRLLQLLMSLLSLSSLLNLLSLLSPTSLSLFKAWIHFHRRFILFRTRQCQ